MNLKKAPPFKDQSLEKKVIFFISLRQSWGTSERMTLQDCLLAQQERANVYLYCLKDSELALRAKSLGISCLYHESRVWTKIYHWPRMKTLAQVMCDELKVHLVHCYDSEILWMLAFFLRRSPLVPLVLTLDHEPRQPYLPFYYRPFIGRIDQVLLPSPQMSKNVERFLGISLRKIDSIGLPCRAWRGEQSSPRPGYWRDDCWHLGANLWGDEENTEFLNVLFNAFRIMVEKKWAGKKIRLILISEKPWDEARLAQDLKEQVMDKGLGDHVSFVDAASFRPFPSFLDLWIGLEKREDLEDYAIEALLNKIPVLLCRNASSVELVRSTPGMGESYRFDDSWSLRQECEKILLNLESYRANLVRARPFLENLYSGDHYTKVLIPLYKKLLKKRKRLFRQKLLLRT